MALVRCPKHKIPYNDENPRGCPACAREKGGERTSLMQELARAQQAHSQPSRTTHTAPAAATAKAPRPPGRTARAPVLHPFAISTRPPKPLPTVQGPLEKLWRGATDKRSFAFGGTLIVVLAAIVMFNAGPRFSAGTSPTPVADADVRPLPLNVNTSITLAFSALGPRSPRANPDDRRLMRYTFGSDLVIDATGSVIYAIKLRIPNRSWRGFRVGMSRQRSEGELALLGVPQEVTTPSSTGQVVAGYVVFGSLDSRPKLTLLAEVRPPNGCYDVLVDLQPQAIGTLDDGSVSYVAVAQEGGSLNWVVTEIRVVSRSRRGPYSSGPAC